METGLAVACIALIATNAYTLWWSLKTRLPANKETIALKRLLATFEHEKSCLLHIEKIDPDSVFLQNPQRGRA